MSPTDESPEQDGPRQGGPSQDGSAAGRAKEDRPESLLDWLSKPRPPFLDEALAPPVDRDLLRKLLRNELSEEQTDEVHRLVISFRSWDDAHTELLTELHRQERAAEGEPGDE